ESYMRGAQDSTFQPTALVNEAYLRLAGNDSEYHDRKHFYALAAQVMRQVLVDRVRAQQSLKRGAGISPEALDDNRHSTSNRLEEFLILDEALTRLSREEPRAGQIIELHYFGGLNGGEIGELLGVSAATVSREQRRAEAWLKRALSQKA